MKSGSPQQRGKCWIIVAAVENDIKHNPKALDLNLIIRIKTQ